MEEDDEIFLRSYEEQPTPTASRYFQRPLRRILKPTNENIISKYINVHGVQKLESLVVIRTDSVIYVHRCQCRRLLNLINRDRSVIQRLIYWFLTDNAVRDFNRCKQILMNRFPQICVTMNRIAIPSDEDDNDNILQFLRTTFRLTLKLMQADTNVLLTGNMNNDEGRSFLNQVYRWFVKRL